MYFEGESGHEVTFSYLYCIDTVQSKVMSSHMMECEFIPFGKAFELRSNTGGSYRCTYLGISNVFINGVLEHPVHDVVYLDISYLIEVISTSFFSK